jgi:hypothetical protein
MKFHHNGLWALFVFLVALLVAGARIEVGLGAAVVASIVLELLTWRGLFGVRRSTRR